MHGRLLAVGKWWIEFAQHLALNWSILFNIILITFSIFVALSLAVTPSNDSHPQRILCDVCYLMMSYPTSCTRFYFLILHLISNSLQCFFFFSFFNLSKKRIVIALLFFPLFRYEWRLLVVIVQVINFYGVSNTCTCVGERSSSKPFLHFVSSFLLSRASPVVIVPK